MTEKRPENTQEESKTELELNTEKYRKYFDVLRRNDAPMVNSFPYIGYLERKTAGPFSKKITIRQWMGRKVIRSVPTKNREEGIEGFRELVRIMIEGWMIIKNIYDKINIDEQDENTGKGILQQNKDLVNRFHPLFIEVAKSALENPELPQNIPEELFELQKLILENSEAYGRLPAVRTYEEIGDRDVIDKTQAKTRGEWFERGKPTKKEWFEKWFGKKEEVKRVKEL